MDRTTALAWAPVVTVRRVESARRELGLGLTATRREIHARYIALARRWHPDKNPDNLAESTERFRRISQAYAFLQTYIRRYRYDFRPETIMRDQEPVPERYRRNFGDALYPGGEETRPQGPDDPLAGPLRLTAENVDWARRKLGLLERVREQDIENRFRAAVVWLNKHGGPNADREKIELHRAAELLRRLVRNYRFSFRPEDIRLAQEDWLQRHRRQFGNDPVWAGGTWHDNPDFTPYPNLAFEDDEEEGPAPSDKTEKNGKETEHDAEQGSL